MAKKKRKKKGGRAEKSKEPVLPGEGEVLCVVERIVGADHALIRCLDNPELLRDGRIPGKMRRRVWIREGDIVIAAVWDFQPKKADITYRYSRDELKRLIVKGLLPKEIAELAGITEEEIALTAEQMAMEEAEEAGEEAERGEEGE
ncbi:MAG: translation initiation factor IF-1A [Crenarchaeota archaeon]|nr:translation initiation factor IF-1A [Thermoproteota archaeon]